MVMRSLLPGRSTSIELTPAAFKRSRSEFLQLQIFAQELGVILLGEPPRPPGLGEPQPESVRMYFLPHYPPISFIAASSFLSPTFTTMCAILL